MAEASFINGGACTKPLKRKRRQSFSEEPELLRHIGGFTPESRDVFASDDEADMMRVPKRIYKGHNDEPDQIKIDPSREDILISELDNFDDETVLFQGTGFQQSFPKQARILMQHLDNALIGDNSITEINCGCTCTPTALELTHTYVTHRLENSPVPFFYDVPNLPCKSIRIADSFDLVVVKDLSVKDILELARCVDYLQVDTLLDVIYKCITIKLSACSVEQVVNFFKTALWPKPDEVSSRTASEQTSDLEEEEMMDDVGINLEKSNFERDVSTLPPTERLEIFPNDDIDETDLDAVLRREGAISNAVAMLRDKQFTPHPLVSKMQIVFWGKIADFSSARRRLLISKQQAKLSPFLLSRFEGKVDEAVGHFTFQAKDCDRKSIQYSVDYLQHHKGMTPLPIAKPIRSNEMQNIVPQWDAEFIDGMSKQELFNVTKTANSLKIESLLHLCCAKVATLIKGKSPDEIRQVLGGEEITESNSN